MEKTMRKSIFPVRSPQGFTLVELMVVIVIVAILAAIAIPGYTSQVRKSRRTEARNALLDAAAREERFYATNNSYTVTGTDLGYGAALPVAVGSNYYQLAATCTGGGKTPCTDYTLTATAINTQAKDTSCTALTLTSVGVQGATGTATAATCWN
jgi:type IV pilus assembly protein PilE